MILPRLLGVKADQVGNAFSAAATARSTMAWSASSTSPITSPVAGLKMSWQARLSPDTS